MQEKIHIKREDLVGKHLIARGNSVVSPSRYCYASKPAAAAMAAQLSKRVGVEHRVVVGVLAPTNVVPDVEELGADIDQQ